MTGDRLRRLVRSVLRGGASTVPLLIAACSGAEDPTPMPLRTECTPFEGDARFAAFTLGDKADGIAIGVLDGKGAALRRLPSLGTPCSKATNLEACNQEIDRLMTVAPSDAPGEVLIATRADDVWTIGRDGLPAFAAPIETLAEASAVISLSLGGPYRDCGVNNAREDPDGWVFRYTLQKSDCYGTTEFFSKVMRADGTITALPTRELEEPDDDDMCTISGRRPSRLAAKVCAPEGSSAATYLDETCRLEAAAVLAFEELARDLDELGAPSELRARLRRARDEEIAHAAITSGLAKRLGGSGRADAGPALARVQDGRPLLLRLAIENAMEGCVRETYGALVAAFQAVHAQDLAIRSAFARIALEETEHAALSLDLARWLDERLDGPARAEVSRARDEALANLAVEIAVAPSDEVARLAGMPTPNEAQALLRLLAA